ncbi:hypothetical protein [Streptomyces sp. NPDC002394]
MSPHEVDQLLDRRLDVCFGHGDQNGDGVLESADALALAARVVADGTPAWSRPPWRRRCGCGRPSTTAPASPPARSS